MTLAEMKTKYLSLMHAVQSGVAMWMNVDSSETQPKHLRVGVNSALIDNGALTNLLIKKGVITEEELFSELCDFAERDVVSYANKLSRHYGKPITLA